MKIGIDARCLEWQRGGVARYLSNMLQIWPKLANHEYVLYFQNKIPEEAYLHQDCMTLRLAKGPALLRKKRILTEQLLFPKMIADDHLDLFYGTWYSAPLFMPAPKSVVAAWDISYSTHPEHYSLANRVSLGFFSRRSSVSANGVVTCSDFDADQIEKYYAVPKEHICTLYLSAEEKFSSKKDKADFEALKSRYKLADRYVLYMGLIYNRRCVDTLIAAYKTIADKYPGTQLVVVGKNATNPKVDLLGQIKPLIESNQARYLEWIPEEDLTRLYQWAHFYVCTSTVDGETIMLKEAMQCGTPVITSSLLKGTIGGHGIIIEDPTDVSQTALALEKSLNMKAEEREQLIVSGLEWVKQFSWQKVAEKSLRFLESV